MLILNGTFCHVLPFDPCRQSKAPDAPDEDGTEPLPLQDQHDSGLLFGVMGSNVLFSKFATNLN